MHVPFRRFRAAIVIGGVLLSGLATSLVPAASAGAASKPAPAVLQIADPGNDGVLAYAKKTGILANALAKVNATVQWGGTYNAGSEEVAAFNAGSLNEDGGANSVIVGGIASGMKATIVAYANSTPVDAALSNAAIVVPANSSIKSVKQLAGHSVAVNQNGHGEYLLLLALQDAGVPFSKVTRLYLPTPAAASAFSTGQLQAWVPFATLLTQAKKEGARVIEYEGQMKGDDDEEPWAFSTSFVQQHPAAVATFVNVLAELTNKMRQNPNPFENVFTSTGPTALNGSDLTTQLALDKATPPVRYPTNVDRQKLQDIANFFYKNGLSPSNYNMASYVASAKEVELLQSQKTAVPAAP